MLVVDPFWCLFMFSTSKWIENLRPYSEKNNILTSFVSVSRSEESKLFFCFSDAVLNSKYLLNFLLFYSAELMQSFEYVYNDVQVEISKKSLDKLSFMIFSSLIRSPAINREFNWACNFFRTLIAIIEFI